MRPMQPQVPRIWRADPALHGSGQWADAAHLDERGYGPRGRHVLGFLPPPNGRQGAIPVTYSGDRHELIVAPTRGGKGVSATIPRLLEHPGGVIALDGKSAELARITARYRQRVLGQNVQVLDPYDEVSSELGLIPAKLNPLRSIDLYGEEPFDQALTLADACVIEEGGGESHWSDEAMALIAGIMLQEVALGGDLASVRAVLNRDADAFAAYVDEMAESPHRLIRAAAGRLSNKAERELSGVLSTAQRNTHFLESDKLAESLSSSTFDLHDLGENTTLYVCLPASRIRTAKRWLRLLLTTLILGVADFPERPSVPVMFLLEEMAALGRLRVIESSFGLMAGFGVQLVAVVQDFNQLQDLYQKRWGTFIANAATIQCFGTNDMETARYLSNLSGNATALNLSAESAAQQAGLFNDPNYLSAQDQHVGRALITPTELMELHPTVQFIKLAASRPVMAYRAAYFLDARFRDRTGRPLYDIHPHHAHRPVPKPVNFVRPGLDLGDALNPYLHVG